MDEPGNAWAIGGGLAPGRGDGWTPFLASACVILLIQVAAYACVLSALG